MKLKRGQVKMSSKFASNLADLFKIDDIFDEVSQQLVVDFDNVQYHWYKLCLFMKDELFTQKRITLPNLIRMHLRDSFDGERTRIRYESLCNMKEETIETVVRKKKLSELQNSSIADLEVDLSLLSLEDLQALIVKNRKSQFRGRDYSKLLNARKDEKEIPQIFIGNRAFRVKEGEERLKEGTHTGRFLQLQSLEIGQLISCKDMVLQEVKKAVIFDITSTSIIVYLASDSRKLGKFRRADGISNTVKGIFGDHMIVFDDEALNLIPDHKNPLKFLPVKVYKNN